MRTVTVNRYLSKDEEEALLGYQLGNDSYDVLLENEDVAVYKPDGNLLLIVKTKAVSADICFDTYPLIRQAAKKTDNRGAAAGVIPQEQKQTANRKIGMRSATRIQPIKRSDGTLSRSDYAGKLVESGIIGYFDRHSRFPFCRQTAWNMENPQAFMQCLPFLQASSRAFAKYVPDRYAAQKAICDRTTPSFVIPGTVFTTITVNRNWPTAVHTDRGDLKAGFGVMAVLRAGKFDGCYFCFPAFRVAVNLHTGDVLLADVHEWHGNTPITGIPGTYERISCVMYYREKMVHCGTVEEELRRAKTRKIGMPLNG